MTERGMLEVAEGRKLLRATTYRGKLSYDHLRPEDRLNIKNKEIDE